MRKILKGFQLPHSLCVSDSHVEHTPFTVDVAIPESSQGAMMVDAPAALAAERADAFQHVEAIMKRMSLPRGWTPRTGTP